MDLIDPDLIRELDALKAGQPHSLDSVSAAYLKKRGYIYDSAEDEARELDQGFSKFQNMERHTATRFFIVPTYNCNARCPYCFVHEMIGQEPLISDQTIDEAFRAMDAIRQKPGHDGPTQLIFFGGEPFIGEPAQMRAVERILERAADRGFLIDAVTNGFDLGEYADLLKKYNFGKAQVTFDGLEDYANKRRPAVDEKGKSFWRIVNSVDRALDVGIDINARILLDKISIRSLPDVVDFFDKKGWFDHPAFGAHVGSTYDCFENLHQKEKRRYLSFFEGNQILVDLCRQKPQIADKIKIDFHGARQFLNTGVLPPANYRSCVGATKTFAFDLHGDIFLCESTVGKQDCRIGTFKPNLVWNDTIMSFFENRSVLTLDTCRSCNQGLLCAGGCPFTGQVKGETLEDLGCRGMKETLEFGLNYYWPQIKQKIKSSPTKPTTSSCCGGTAKCT
jgi:uncharacterized protein